MNRFVHYGACGDIVYSLPTVIAMGGGAIYTNKKFYDLMSTFLLTQDAIEDVHLFTPFIDIPNLWMLPAKFTLANGDEYINLDYYRNVVCKDEKMNLVEAHLSIYDLQFDLAKPWVFNITSETVAPLVISVSKRHHDSVLPINYKLLKPYANKAIFIGRSADYRFFKEVSGFYVKQYICNPKRVGLQLAQIIKGSKLFVGNQSLGFALAEAMKVPRILEVFHKKPNCMPHGDNWYTEISEEMLERYLNKC